MAEKRAAFSFRRFFALGFSKRRCRRTCSRVCSRSSFFLSRRRALSTGSPFFSLISVINRLFRLSQTLILSRSARCPQLSYLNIPERTRTLDFALKSLTSTKAGTVLNLMLLRAGQQSHAEDHEGSVDFPGEPGRCAGDGEKAERRRNECGTHKDS